MVIPHPPAIAGFEITHGVRLRYTVNAALAAAITFQNLLDTVNFATTTTAPFNLFQMVKIRRIQLWTVPALGTASSLLVVFNGVSGGAVGDNVTHTDTSMGIEPAYLDVSPSRRSLSKNYQISNANIAFTLDVPIGTVIDVDLSFRGSVLSFAKAAQNASVAAVVGATFWRGLDGLPVATTAYILPPGIAQY